MVGQVEGRRPVVAKESAPRVQKETKHLHERRSDAKPGSLNDGFGLTGAEWVAWAESHPTTITGYACACPDDSAPTTPARVLDPFGGTGTTAMVARTLGRFGVSVDLSADYCRLSRWRIFESGHGEKAAQRTHRENQSNLFDNAPFYEDVEVSEAL